MTKAHQDGRRRLTEIARKLTNGEPVAKVSSWELMAWFYPGRKKRSANLVGRIRWELTKAGLRTEPPWDRWPPIDRKMTFRLIPAGELVEDVRKRIAAIERQVREVQR